ncbi:MAG TPA: septum site-determining protein MinC [Anaerolineaceae bacterium]|nr:septum site-determining protein MinC [Anaerolineaceae bacterium]
MTTSNTIQIKGIREGLLISLGDGEWIDVQIELMEKIREKENFFHGAKLAIEVGNRILSVADLGTLRDRLANFDISLWAVLSNSPITERKAQDLGLATRISVPKPERVIKSIESSLPGEDAILVRKTIRSGFRVVSNGHIMILGDVNPGAEIISGGSVIIWGRCLGVVHAGVEGNTEAIVCALDLNPTQLRIADIISISPKRKGKPQPEIVKIIDGQVVAEAWNPKTR